MTWLQFWGVVFWLWWYLCGVLFGYAAAMLKYTVLPAGNEVEPFSKERCPANKPYWIRESAVCTEPVAIVSRGHGCMLGFFVAGEEYRVHDFNAEAVWVVDERKDLCPMGRALFYKYFEEV